MKKQLGYAYFIYYSFLNFLLSPFKFLNLITIPLMGFKLIDLKCPPHYTRKHAVEDLKEAIKEGVVDYKSVCFKEEDNLFKISYYDKEAREVKQCELCTDCKALGSIKRDFNNLRIFSCDK